MIAGEKIMKTISRRNFIASGGAGLAALALGCHGSHFFPQPAAPRPNIIFLLTDDQGYGELGCHGNPILKTPHLDRFNAESVRFDDFQASPTCSPTRCSLMTGRHEFKSGVTHTIHERERMSLKSVTIARILKSAGYATGIFGKWHLGDEDEYQPGRRGFDEVFIHGGGAIGQKFTGSCADAPGNKYFDPVIRHNGTFEKTRGYCTDVFFSQATRWMDEQRKKGIPFFAYLPTNAPHAPYICPKEYQAMYEGKGLPPPVESYYGMISNIDDNFGKLLRTLKAWGIDKNTLVVFMGDNGHPVFRKPDNSPHDDIFNAGMKGLKSSPHQGGVRVSCLMRLPQISPRGGTVKQLTCALDIFPTFAELSGAAIPAELRMDGRSLTPLMKNPAVPWEDRCLVTHSGRWPKGANPDDYKYKEFAVRNARFRLVNGTELYDIPADPGETTNVIERYPEEVKRMREVYEKWWAEVRPLLINEDAAGPEVGPYVAAFKKQFGDAATAASVSPFSSGNAASGRH